MAEPENRLILIGYWRGPGCEQWPDPRDFVDEDWDEDERGAVSDYLGAGFFFRLGSRRAPCRLCGRPNGAGEYTDGTYAWPEGLGHYVDTHDVRLPEPFVRHVIARFEAWDAAAIDGSWWHGVADSVG